VTHFETRQVGSTWTPHTLREAVPIFYQLVFAKSDHPARYTTEFGITSIVVSSVVRTLPAAADLISHDVVSPLFHS